MSLPKNSAASGLVYGIVVGGHDQDPAPDQSGNLRVYFPGIHGKDVDIKHLNFSPRLMSPTKATQQEFPGGLDPGSLVVAFKDTGSNYCQIIGLANDTNLADQRIPGNSDLLQFVNQFLNQTVNIRVPPNITETMEGGVRVRKATEKGQRHNHNLLKGIPTHGALYPMAGSVMPRVSGVATAVQAFDNLLTGDILSNIPGTIMTLGKMFSVIQSSGLFKDINKAVPREVGYAIQSIGNLIQNVETMEGSGFNVGGRVDQSTYIDNSVQLFRQARNVAGVVGAMSRLQSDSSLFGLDKIANNIINAATGFGASQLSISATGSIMRYLPPETSQAIGTAMKLISLFNSAYPGQNLFGGSAEQIFNMLNRLSPQSLAFAIAQLTRLNAGPVAQSFNATNLTTVLGGNPFLIP